MMKHVNVCLCVCVCASYADQTDPTSLLSTWWCTAYKPPTSICISSVHYRFEYWFRVAMRTVNHKTFVSSINKRWMHRLEITVSMEKLYKSDRYFFSTINNIIHLPYNIFGCCCCCNGHRALSMFLILCSFHASISFAY